MDRERLDMGREQSENIRLTPPPVELLTNKELATDAWPENIVRDKEFIAQIESREKLNDRLELVLSRLPRPDTSLQEAISQNLITEDEASDLYESLGELIKDGDYERAALYMPFELLPNATWKPSSEKLNDSAKRFKDAYMGAWNSLLNVQDVRANFVDGDVLEVEARTGDLERVVKAAHLIPKLVEVGWIAPKDVLALMATTKDATLKQSIAETLPVLADLGFMDPADIPKEKSDHDDQPGLEIPISPKRAQWLKEEAERKAVELAGDVISASIQNNTFNRTEIADQEAYINGIRKAVEVTAKKDIEAAKNLYAQYKDVLLSSWSEKSQAGHEEVLKTFCRLNGIGIVDDEQLGALGITIPDLDGSFSKNLESAEAQIQEIKTAISSIENDPELSQFLYPIALVYGSRLKGYGRENADMDIAMLVKPNTPSAERKLLQEKLKAIFTHKDMQGPVVEFWLKETEKDLAVSDPEGPEANRGGQTWTHVLFGAAWEGNEDAIRELREKLLVPYFSDKEKNIYGMNARALYLEEMERDTLQYRLMHKGYERYFPSYGGIQTPHSDNIDGKSAFWDSGYRDMAIKLFASKVFLPKI